MLFKTKISVRAHPGAKVAKVKETGGKLHVWVTERAINGRANRAIEIAVAKHFGVPQSHVSIVSGHTSRDKVMMVAEG